MHSTVAKTFFVNICEYSLHICKYGYAYTTVVISYNMNLLWDLPALMLSIYCFPYNNKTFDADDE